jgi:hypothetical protein
MGWGRLLNPEAALFSRLTRLSFPALQNTDAQVQTLTSELLLSYSLI